MYNFTLKSFVYLNLSISKILLSQILIFCYIRKSGNLNIEILLH